MACRAVAQDSVEYALIIATVAVLTLLAAVTFGEQISQWFVALAERVIGT